MADRGRGGLAGDEAPVEFGTSRLDNAVDRDALAAAEEDAIAGLDRGDGGNRPASVRGEPRCGLGLERGEIAGEIAGAPPHQLVEIASDQQEEEQHHHAVEISVAAMAPGFGDRHGQRQHHTDGDRHVHIDRAGLQRPERAFEEGPAGIGGGRQGDQGGEPVEEVARRRVDVAAIAGPDRDREQHDVHRGEAGDAEPAHQAALLGDGAILLPLRHERIGLEAEHGELVDDRFRPQQRLPPFDRDALQREIDAGAEDGGLAAKPALNRLHAAGTADAVDSQLHAGDAAIATTHEDGEILPGHIISPAR